MKEKLEIIKSEGFENLQFVLDFDRTITGPVNDEPAPPMISFLRNSDILGEEYKLKAQANFEYYYKFEKSQELTLAEKHTLMHEWWDKHLNLLVEYKLDKEKINSIANSKNLILRAGVKELFEFCNLQNIQIIIFSAAILGSESIKLFLERNNINYPEIKIITNELIFDESGLVTGFKEPLIHSENKDESVFDVEGITQRKNSIVVGDGIGDSKMVLDKDDSTIYRIGILDKKRNLIEGEFENEKQIYLNHFDQISNNFDDILESIKN